MEVEPVRCPRVRYLPTPCRRLCIKVDLETHRRVSNTLTFTNGLFNMTTGPFSHETNRSGPGPRKSGSTTPISTIYTVLRSVPDDGNFSVSSLW